MLPKLLWFITALGIAWSVNGWRHGAALQTLDEARNGDREAAEAWVGRTLRNTECELHEAREYLSSSSSRPRVWRPDYVETFVEKLYAGGARDVEVCESRSLGYPVAHYLLITFPDEETRHERIIAHAQSMVRRDAVVYRGATSAEAEEIVRTSTLIGERRLLADLPAKAD